MKKKVYNFIILFYNSSLGQNIYSNVNIDSDKPGRGRHQLKYICNMSCSKIS